MTAGPRRDLMFDLAIAVPALASLLGPAASPLVPPAALTWLGALTKLAFLGLAAGWAFRASAFFEPGSGPRTASRLLAAGFLGFFLGQVSLTPYQLFLGGTAPFPSVGDVFFFLAYPFLVSALFLFARAYQEAGHAGGTPASRRLTVLTVAAASALIAYPVLKPIVAAPAPPLATFLNLAYPVLDLVLLVPTALLIQITLPFRRGEIGKAWITLLAGLLALCVADIAFAYFSALGQKALDPLLNAMYIVSYGLMARGVRRQQRLLGA